MAVCVLLVAFSCASHLTFDCLFSFFFFLPDSGNAAGAVSERIENVKTTTRQLLARQFQSGFSATSVSFQHRINLNTLTTKRVRAVLGAVSTAIAPAIPRRFRDGLRADSYRFQCIAGVIEGRSQDSLSADSEWFQGNLGVTIQAVSGRSRGGSIWVWSESRRQYQGGPRTVSGRIQNGFRVIQGWYQGGLETVSGRIHISLKWIQWVIWRRSRDGFKADPYRFGDTIRGIARAVYTH